MPNDENNSDNFDSMDDNEELDPKKNIQKLTGKLSQELRMYNKDSNDEELNKYVAGMIIPQSAKFLSQDDKDDLIKKINSSESDSDENENTNQDDSDIQMENRNSVNHFIDEIVNTLIDKRKEGKKKSEYDNIHNPFVSNR